MHHSTDSDCHVGCSLTFRLSAKSVLYVWSRRFTRSFARIAISVEVDHNVAANIMCAPNSRAVVR